MAGPGEKIDIKISGDSSELAGALADVATRIEALVDALAGTTQKFDETGKVATEAMSSVEKQTDKATKATKKANKEVKSLAATWDAQAKSAAQAAKALRTERYESYADAAGRTDSAMSAFASVLDKVNPQMAETARMLGDVAGASEQMILAMTQAPVAFGVAAVAVAGFELATRGSREEAEKFEEQNKATSKSLDKQIKILVKTEKLHKRLQAELDKATGKEEDLVDVYQKEVAEIERLIGKQKQMAVARMLSTASPVQFAAAQRDLDMLEARRVAMIDLAAETLKAASAQDSWLQALSRSEKRTKRMVTAIGDGTAKTIEWTDAQGEFHREIVMTEEVLGDVNKQLIEENDALSAGGSAISTYRSSIALLNDSLVKLGEAPEGFESWRISMRHADDETGEVAQAYGAFNVLTGETIDLTKLATLANDTMVDSINMKTEAVKTHTSAVKKDNGWLEKIIEMQFQLENSFESSGIAAIRASRHRVEALEAEAKALGIDAYAHEEFRNLIVDIERELERDLEKINNEGIEERTTALESELQARHDANQASFDAMAEFYAHDAELAAQFLAEKSQADEIFLAEKKDRYDAYYASISEMEEARLERDADIAAAMAERSAEALQSVMGGVASFAGDLSSFMSDKADEMAETDRQKAQDMFDTAKAAALAQALINGALAIGEIWAKWSVMPPVALALSAVAAANTGMQVATIKATEPSFHMGGMRQPSTDPGEFSARVLPGESVLNRQATKSLGSSGVAAMNRGSGAPQIQVVPIPAYKHFDRFIGDEYKRQGRFTELIQDARTRPLGQRGY